MKYFALEFIEGIHIYRMYKARKHLGRFIIRIYLKKNKECIEFIYLFGDFLSICCACNTYVILVITFVLLHMLPEELFVLYLCQQRNMYLPRTKKYTELAISLFTT